MSVESFYTHCFAISSWSLHSSVVPTRCQQVHAIQQYSVPAFLLVSAVIKVSFLDSTSFPNFQISVYAACILVTCLSVGCTTPWVSLYPCTLLIVLAGVCILGLLPTGFLIISFRLCIFWASCSPFPLWPYFPSGLCSFHSFWARICLFALFTSGPYSFHSAFARLGPLFAVLYFGLFPPGL